MKFGVPWSVKGIRPEARETAREAARRSGMSLGDWLNTVILDKAAEHGIAPEQDEIDEDELGSVHERLDELTHKIERLNRSGPAAYAPKRARGESDQLAQLISRLDHRLDELVSGRPPLPTPPERWTAPPLAPATPPLPGSNIDRAIAEITARQRALEGNQPVPPARRPAAPAPQTAAQPVPPQAPPLAPLPPTIATPARAPLPAQDLSGLEEQLRNITSQIETLRRPGVEEAINALRAELGEIAHSLTEALPRRAMDTIEKEIHGLSQRLAEGRQAGVDATTLSSIEHGLAEVRDSLRSLTPAENLIGFNEAVNGLAHKIDLIVAQKDPQTLQQLESAITTLRGIASHVASNEAVGELAVQVRELSNKVDYIAHASTGGDALSHLEQRIAALSDALAARAQNGETVPPRLENLVNSLADKIEQVQQVQMSGGDSAALGHLEDRIVRLVEKLDASDSRLGHLEAIERGLADLLVQVQSGKGAADLAAPPAVEELKRDLARTQDSLEAVNGTLGLVVDRLAMIEQGLRTPPAPAPPPPAPMSLQQPVQQVAAQVVAQVAAAAAAAQPKLPEAANLQPPPAQPASPKPSLPPRKQQPIDPDLPPDHPIEPGSAPRGRGAPADPAARIAASEAALGPVKPPVIPDPGGKSNFIAAARRAAQAAAQEPPPPAPAPKAAPKAAPLRAEPGMHPDIEDTSAGSKFARRIKSFFVASSVVAIIVGSVQLGLSWLTVPEQKVSATRPETPTEPAKPVRQAQQPPTPEQFSTVPRVITPDITAASMETINKDTGKEAATPTAPMTVTVPGAAMGSVPLLGIPAPPASADITGSVPSVGARNPAMSIYPVTVPPLPGGERLPSAIGGALLRNAAASGDSAAAYEVALRFAEGRGVPQSLDSAARWFERAANKGLAPAQFRLGSLYEKGQGVKKDLGQARRYYVAAAEAGNAKAMHNLAVLYAEGIDGKPDYATAAQWFRKAAERGVSDSQYNLGILHARGLGVEKSFIESYKWFALAAAQGDKESGKKRDDVANKLEPQALAAAQNTVKTWAPQPQPDLAVTVPAPPEGWDHATPASAPARPKISGPMKLGAR